MSDDYQRRPIMRAAVALLVLAVTPAVARAQGGGMAPTPLAVDLKKAKLGDWSEYSMSAGPRSGKLRWALISREGENHTLEMTMEGGPQMGGQKMALQMTLVPNPTTASKPVKKLVMQMGTMDPMEMPLDMPGMQGQRFEKPDPKKKVGQGKEQLKVAAGNFSTDHYRDTVPQGTVDVWVNDTVVPLGLVKMTLTPSKEAGPGAGPMSLELTSRGKGAKPNITKAAKPFDPAAFGMPGGHGAPPPKPPSAPPPSSPPPKK
jgi:hypothetical protein